MSMQGLPQTFNELVKSTLSMSVKHDKVQHNKTMCAYRRLWRSLSVRNRQGEIAGMVMETMMDLGFQLSYTWHRMFQYSSSENKMENMKTSLVAQWLRLHTSSAGGMGSISGWGNKILLTEGYGQKKLKMIFKNNIHPRNMSIDQ